eukprot:14862_1
MGTVWNVVEIFKKELDKCLNEKHTKGIWWPKLEEHIQKIDDDNWIVPLGALTIKRQENDGAGRYKDKSKVIANCHEVWSMTLPHYVDGEKEKVEHRRITALLFVHGNRTIHSVVERKHNELWDAYWSEHKYMEIFFKKMDHVIKFEKPKNKSAIDLAARGLAVGNTVTSSFNCPFYDKFTPNNVAETLNYDYDEMIKLRHTESKYRFRSQSCEFMYNQHPNWIPKTSNDPNCKNPRTLTLNKQWKSYCNQPHKFYISRYTIDKTEMNGKATSFDMLSGNTDEELSELDEKQFIFCSKADNNKISRIRTNQTKTMTLKYKHIESIKVNIKRFAANKLAVSQANNANLLHIIISDVGHAQYSKHYKGYGHHILPPLHTNLNFGCNLSDVTLSMVINVTNNNHKLTNDDWKGAADIFQENGLKKIAAEIRERRQRYNSAEAKHDGRDIKMLMLNMVRVCHRFIDMFQYNVNERRLLDIIQFFWIHAAKLSYLSRKSDINDEDVEHIYVDNVIILMVYALFRLIENLVPSDIRFWQMLAAEILMIYDQYGHCIYNWSEESGEAIHPKIKDAFYKYYKLADTLTTSQFCNKIKNDVELQFHCYATATLTKKDRQKSNTNKLTREQKQQQNMEKSNPYNCTVRVDIDSIRIFWCAYCNSEKVSVKNERCKYCRNNRTFEILTNLVNTLKEKGYPNGITDDWKIMFNEVGLEYKQLENELKALKNRSKLEEQYKKT